MRQHHQWSLTWPILLIVVGSLLLLDQVGILALSWARLWRLWPLVLVLIGLEMVLGRSRAGVLAYFMLASVLIVGVVGLAPSAWSGLKRSGMRYLSYDGRGVDAATVRIEMGVGELEVSPLEDSSMLYEADVSYDKQRTDVGATVTRDGARAEVLLKSTHHGWSPWGGRALDKWRVRLNSGVPIRLDVSSGVNRARLDLGHLALTRLDLRMGVGDVELALSDTGPYHAYIDGGVGRLDIRIPSEIEARIRVDGGLGDVKIGPRFRRAGRYYATAGYDASPEAIDVDIDGGIGVISVH